MEMKKIKVIHTILYYFVYILLIASHSKFWGCRVNNGNIAVIMGHC